LVAARKPTPERKLWITQGVKDWLMPSGRHPDRQVTLDSIAYARQQCNSFVLGRAMFENEDLKHLHPYRDEVWEIRSLLQPQIRIFGWFPAPNRFIATRCRLRKDLNGQSFGEVIAKVKVDRGMLLPGVPLFSGFQYSDYVTN